MAINFQNQIDRYQRYYKSIEPKLEKPKNKAYTTIIFSILVISLFGLYAIRPTIQTIILLKREIQDKTELSKKMEDKIAALIEAQAYYQEIEPLLPIVSQALPTIPDAIPLLIQLRNLASMSATTITAIQLPSTAITNPETPGAVDTKNPSAAKPTKQETFDITMSIKGPYSNIHAFIEGITIMRRLGTIESISIAQGTSEQVSTQSAKPNTKLLQLALKLKAYYLVN